jgi:hypothetical protein
MEEVRVVLLEARPSHEAPEFKEVAGAFVNIYTTATSEAEALSIASSEMADAGWIIVAVENQYSLTRAEAQAAPDSLPYFEQALLDGIVLVFHNYPHGGEDPTALH